MIGRSVHHRFAIATVAVLAMACSMAACGVAQPEIAGDQSTSFDRLTGTDGQSYLQEVSGYEWNDDGSAAAKSLA